MVTQKKNVTSPSFKMQCNFTFYFCVIVQTQVVWQEKWLQQHSQT